MMSRRHRRMARRSAGEAQRGSGADRSRPAIPVREVVAAAARAGRSRLWLILAVAVVVSTVTALVEIIVDDVIDRANVPLSIFGDLSATGVSILGTVLLSGLLCRVVGETERGKESASLLQVARTLPWARLIWADLLVVLLVVIGAVLLVIPGLVAFTLFAVVGPVIEIENRPVIAALRRSAHLVRQRFWTVALLATLPVLLASEIESITPHPSSAGAILEVVAIRGLGEALVEAAIGLILVALCYRLLAADRAAAATERDHREAPHQADQAAASGTRRERRQPGQASDSPRT